jgi:hypothetical protein
VQTAVGESSARRDRHESSVANIRELVAMEEIAASSAQLALDAALEAMRAGGEGRSEVRSSRCAPVAERAGGGAEAQWSGAKRARLRRLPWRVFPHARRGLCRSAARGIVRLCFAAEPWRRFRGLAAVSRLGGGFEAWRRFQSLADGQRAWQSTRKASRTGRGAWQPRNAPWYARLGARIQSANRSISHPETTRWKNLSDFARAASSPTVCQAFRVLCQAPRLVCQAPRAVGKARDRGAEASSGIRVALRAARRAVSHAFSGWSRAAYRARRSSR